jgi:hypothetical protein
MPVPPKVSLKRLWLEREVPQKLVTIEDRVGLKTCAGMVFGI